VSPKPHVPEAQPRTLRLVVTLALAGLFSGLAIVSAYEITLPRIEANKAAALKRAVFQVVPGSVKMERMEWSGDELVPKAGGAEGAEAVYAAYDSAGTFKGYAIPGKGPGFQDTIELIYGYDPAREMIVGLQILESRETPGLGDRIYKDPAFAANFKDLAVKPEIELVKGGRKAPNQVDAITGATISSTAVVKIVRNTNEEWLSRLPAAGSPPDTEGTAPAGGAPADTAGAEGE
jgi:electron transport complex protein RnfG